ncbi:MAG TPA: hypothetical protein VGD80_22065, partial [Kofleriaceae bacterium]
MAIEPANAAARAPRFPRIYIAAIALLAPAYFGAVLVATGSPGPALRATVIAVVPGVAFAVAVLRIGRRARWFEGPRRRLVAVHAALCAGYTVAWAFALVILFAVDRWLFVPGAPFQIQ